MRSTRLYRRAPPDQARVAALRRARHPVRHHISSDRYVAQRFSDPEIINEFNVAGWSKPDRKLCVRDAAEIQARQSPCAPLYIALMGTFPTCVWRMRASPA